MSLDISLKGKSTLERHRNVLRRAERVAVLEDADKFTEGKNSVFGIVKVGHRKIAATKKVAKTAEAADGTAAAGAAAPAGKAAAPAAKAAPAKK